jgi:ribosomal protein S18 acetylase RimI-like enzyme
LIAVTPLTDSIALICPRDSATHIRLAAPTDEPFVRHLYKSSRTAEFAAATLPPSALDTLLDQQFGAQGRGYAAQFPEAVTLIIVHDARPIGRLILHADHARWRIVDIVLLPEARGRGVGTDVLEALVRAARNAGAAALDLSVLATNVAARRLYARLGFEPRDSGVHISMTRRFAE